MKSNNINYAWPVTTLCIYDYKSLKELVEKNKKKLNETKIVIFGAGIRGTSFSLLLKKWGYNNICFVDNNVEKVGAFINDFSIISYAEVENLRGKIVVIISVENGTVLKNQLEKSGFLENEDYFYVDNHLYQNYLKEFEKKDDLETLIMGDCGITDISLKDNDFTNLGDMLKNLLGYYMTKVLAVHGMGMRAFYHILKIHIAEIQKPKRVILMTNLEIFTGKQNLLPRSQHVPLIEMLNNLINKSDNELAEYLDVVKERFSNFKMDYFTSSEQAMSNMSQNKNNGIIMKMNYMYKMDLNNECIVYLRKFIHLCKSNDIQLLLFIPPANYAYAEQFWKDSFRVKYGENTDILQKLANSEQIEMLDLSYELESDKFADFSTIDETLNVEGRKVVADLIVKKVKEM